jgi:hypothetical protein
MSIITNLERLSSQVVLISLAPHYDKVLVAQITTIGVTDKHMKCCNHYIPTMDTFLKDNDIWLQL